MYFLSLQVVPNAKSPYSKTIAGAYASFWILGDSAEAALARSHFMVRKYEWDVVALDVAPTVVTRDNFNGKDIGLDEFDLAQKEGVASAYIAWSKDGKSSSGPITMERTDAFDSESFQSEIKRQRRKGCCLHYDAGVRCSSVIDAHSIQKNGALSLIADAGNVYALSRNFTDIKKMRGGVCFTRQGIGTVSTFRGFCERHDTEVFTPIDTHPLQPTPQQILLYAYRSLCREVFVKEVAFQSLEQQAKHNAANTAIHTLLDDVRQGTEIGLKNLKLQKQLYDHSLSTESYSDVKYVVFHSSQIPTIVFSGLSYPDFDFLGRQLQILGKKSQTLDLITFSFAPMSTGWGFVFAWHVRNDKTCLEFMKSLATRIAHDRNPGDHLFRLVLSTCENLAIAPQWWDSLSQASRNAVEKAASLMTDVFSPIRSDFITSGLEGISGWQFDEVFSDMD